MTYEEAQKQSLNVKWKTEDCHSDNCWCKIIVPAEPLLYDGDSEYAIACAGALSTIHAEHIVKLHNDHIAAAAKMVENTDCNCQVKGKTIQIKEICGQQFCEWCSRLVIKDAEGKTKCVLN